MANHGPGHLLMKRGKRGAAAVIHSNVVLGTRCHLEFLLDILLNPANAIDEWETIDWCKWLMAGGRTPEEFSNIVKCYDNATTCGLVWTANFVAYRCRTCGISPCMSLCAECFQRGDHDGHDFNMFRSQAGGACDCGDTFVMKESGFCDRHGPKSQENKPSAPNDLMCVTEALMPRIILRLIHHLRENSKSSSAETLNQAIQEADPFLSMMHDLSAMGAAMRRAMTSALTNPQVYRQLTDPTLAPHSSEMSAYLEESHQVYKEALKSLPNPEPIPEHKDIYALQEVLTHSTFLEELVFWTVKFEFPQKIVCLLLNMLPDPDYKEALTQAFVLHYSRISMMLEKSLDPDTLSNRVVHVSVQLFSNEALAVRMVDKFSLLHVMVISLKYMMTKILIPNTLHDPYQNFHFVVDCGRPVMKEHCYWPLVSDLNNVLSHHPVAVRFMSDDSLLDTWFLFLSMFQGMNVNVRELIQHVEFEPNTYYAAFSAELEASAYPMWALLSHLQSPDTVDLTRKVLTATMNALQDWFDAIHMVQLNIAYNNQVSFHLPLHRYLAVFMCQAVNIQGLPLAEVLPPTNLLHLIMIHPLRVQVAFYEILNGLWVRNGLQIKGQAMTYIQCNFCNSMVDADLYLLQVCAMILPPQTFIQTVLYRFHVTDWLSFSSHQESGQNHLDSNQDTDPPMLESCLTFLASLISLRTNLGSDQRKLSELELVTLLCMGDKTHSQLMELMPERCGTVSSCRDFESVLDRVAEYRAPNLDSSGVMQQGMYSPKSHVWLRIYDPIHVLLRAVHRRDFQSSLDRYNHYLASSGKMQGGSAWPPYREPGPCHPAYSDPRRVLKSKVFHAVAWIVLYKALTQHNVTEHVASLIVYLLEMAVAITLIDNDNTNKAFQVCNMDEKSERSVKDGNLDCWFESDWLSSNLRTVISTIVLPPQLDIIFDSDSDEDWTRETRSSNLAIGGEVDDPLGLESALPLAIPSSLVPSQSSDIKDNERKVGGLRPLMMLVGKNTSAEQMQLVSASSFQPTPSSSSASTDAPLALPTTENQVVVAGKRSSGRSEGMSSSSSPPDKTIEANESIISLLLKLHSQLAGAPDSFDPDAAPPSSEDSAVGDGPHFVGKLLRRIMELDDDCRQAVVKTREVLWPRQPDESAGRREAEARQKEERRRKAKERQQKLMEEFASRQKQFMERQAMETEDEGMECGGVGSEGVSRCAVEYDCVICNQSSVSTEEKPMGLAVLVQATSVLGARRRSTSPPLEATWAEQSGQSPTVSNCEVAGGVGGGVLLPPPPKRRSSSPSLPTSDKERAALRLADTMASTFDLRIEEMDRQFNQEQWALNVNIGWEGGVHVQTCGHHLHLDCLKSYLISLRSQQRLAAERGEYACPLCRQLANSVLPLPPSPTPPPSAASASLLHHAAAPPPPPPSSHHHLSAHFPSAIEEMLRDNPPKPDLSRIYLVEAMKKSLDDMTNATFPKYRGELRGHRMPQMMFLFITSIARTNLEIEIVQRGGSLLTPGAQSAGTATTTGATTTTTTMPKHLLVPKRSSISALIHVLREHARTKVQWSVWDSWAELTRPAKRLSNASVPALLADPSALLIQFILLLPLHLDITYFTYVVKILYNLTYFQVVTQISTSLTPSERSHCQTVTCGGSSASSLDEALSLVVSILDQTGLYNNEKSSTSSSAVSLAQAEQAVRVLLLPFLRVAALLRHHLYEEALPEIDDRQQEFLRLVYYLELVQEGMSFERFNSSVAVTWPFSDYAGPWLRRLGEFVVTNEVSARTLITTQHVQWSQPRLLSLPTLYDKIFQFYHGRQCTQCHIVPKETSICLLCGTLVCLKENCCKQHNICEAVQHSIDCGAGTAMYLVVTSSYVIVIRGRRACLWGSVYLDTFGEEDRELKRGKPLYLSPGRYELLQQQWLSHRFDHTNKKWVWHRDAL